MSSHSDLVKAVSTERLTVGGANLILISSLQGAFVISILAIGTTLLILQPEAQSHDDG